MWAIQWWGQLEEDGDEQSGIRWFFPSCGAKRLKTQVINEKSSFLLRNSLIEIDDVYEKNGCEVEITRTKDLKKLIRETFPEEIRFTPALGIDGSPLILVMRCAIWYHLYNLKNVKNTHRGVLILLKLTLLHGCFSSFLNCTNGTKSRNSPHLCLWRDPTDYALIFLVEAS